MSAGGQNQPVAGTRNFKTSHFEVIEFISAEAAFAAQDRGESTQNGSTTIDYLVERQRLVAAKDCARTGY
jgi:hypothetical protein